ncbi:unnamed protein product, partial [Ectocarpus sp. 12 AP-2014]
FLGERRRDPRTEGAERPASAGADGSGFHGRRACVGAEGEVVEARPRVSRPLGAAAPVGDRRRTCLASVRPGSAEPGRGRARGPCGDTRGAIDDGASEGLRLGQGDSPRPGALVGDPPWLDGREPGQALLRGRGCR